MEAMRFKPPIIPGLPRYVNQTVKLKSIWREKTIPKGSTVIVATMSAMLDPKRIEKANEFTRNAGGSRDGRRLISRSEETGWRTTV